MCVCVCVYVGMCIMYICTYIIFLERQRAQLASLLEGEMPRETDMCCVRVCACVCVCVCICLERLRAE